MRLIIDLRVFIRNEFRQEAYLFIPFDEEYYQSMAKVIAERFENWQGQDFDEDILEPSDWQRSR